MFEMKERKIFLTREYQGEVYDKSYLYSSYFKG